MASNSEKYGATFNDKENDGQCGESKEPEKHPFSEPWEDSDLILVVEDDKFHVHRQILSIHSPVFKAMLNSQFKEARATQIPLPGKKASEILDFLKQLYLQEREGVTLKKVEHLLKLADEYQVTGILDACVKCLKDEAKSEENVVEILFLANHTVNVRDDSRLDGVRKNCYDLIKNMELEEIRKKSGYNNLDRESLESALVERIERLETFLKGIYPQFFGAVECCLWACIEMDNNHSHISPCPQHFSGSKPYTGVLQRIKSCSVCRRMIQQLVSFLQVSQESHSRLMYSSNCAVAVGTYTPQSFGKYKYGGNYHFDDKLIDIILDLEKVMGLNVWVL